MSKYHYLKCVIEFVENEILLVPLKALSSLIEYRRYLLCHFSPKVWHFYLFFPFSFNVEYHTCWFANSKKLATVSAWIFVKQRKTITLEKPLLFPCITKLKQIRLWLSCRCVKLLGGVSYFSRLIKVTTIFLILLDLFLKLTLPYDAVKLNPNRFQRSIYQWPSTH